jgi:enoyl-[acyl-carrier protein] reductase I
MSAGLLEGKKGIVLGVANKRSIAWAISQACSDAGATLGFNYLNDRLKPKVEELVDTLPGDSHLYECDVTQDEHLSALTKSVEEDLGSIDFIVHSVAFAKKEDLENQFVNTSRDGFKLALDISSYSLTAVSHALLPLMNDGGSIMTMTYLGGERAVQNYNVMGVAKAALESSVRYLALNLGEKQIRVNAISAGPVNTLAARGISGFTEMLKVAAARAPLKRNVELEEVAGTALFLASDMSTGITGQTIYVDCGYNIVGFST